MAQTEYFREAGIQNLTVPSGTVSGDPVAVGKIVGVAETDRDATTGKARVQTAAGRVFKLQVKGVDGSGNSAVAVGDYLYYVSADTPKINKKATGVLFGKALEAVASGATTEIQVLLIQA